MYLYFCFKSSVATEDLGPGPATLQTTLWHPRLTSFAPAGLPLYPFGVWWIFHYCRIFSNEDYGVVLVSRGGEIVHRSCVFPGYFRFPFMAKGDLQIGDVWTRGDFRGKGLGRATLRWIVSRFRESDRRFWYITSQDNFASIRLAESAGFRRVGCGRRVPRLGSDILGQYMLEKTVL